MKPEPKSIHTYLDTARTRIHGYEIDVRITVFPRNPNPDWLYYFSLSVPFTEGGEWAHGGFQWSGVFKNNLDSKGVNWGGMNEKDMFIGRTNTMFAWETDKWYRYQIQRMGIEKSGYYSWLFEIADYEAGTKGQFGIVRTKSPWIAGRNLTVFTETGYGVQCDSPGVRVEWRDPFFTTPEGRFRPDAIIANYNGTCVGPANTNQGKLSETSLYWFHETNAPRTVHDGTDFWRF